MWSDLYEQPAITTWSNEAARVIADVTRNLQQVVHEQLILFSNRASALAACAQFDAALRDAAAMRVLAPSSPLGYLCTGRVYALQGRQTAAINMYDQGLAVIAPISDPSILSYQQQLIEAKTVAQQREDLCIDFIRQLPVDIVQNITSAILSGVIGPNELREYICVSKIWRERMLLCTDDLHVHSGRDDDLGDNAYLLACVSPHITALTVEREASQCHQLLLRARFQSLRYMRGAEILPAEYHPMAALNSLMSVRSTLTHLDVTEDTWAYKNISLGDLLSACPNLVTLRCHGITGDIAKAPSSCPKLKTLLFWMSNELGYLNHDYLMDMTRRLPALEQLAVHPCVDTRALPLIQDHCPNLRHLSYNDSNERQDYMHTVASKTTTDGTSGVQTFHINWEEEDLINVDPEDVLAFMSRNNHSLQRIYFFYTLPRQQPATTAMKFDRAIQAASSKVFDQLISYTHVVCNAEDALLAQWLARRSPVLKEVVLVPGHTHRECDLDALFANLACLPELQIVRIHVPGNYSFTSINQFIQHHSVSVDSQLHTLAIPRHTPISRNTLDALARLPRLENLDININAIQDSDLVAFMGNLAGGCPKLQHLSISTETKKLADEVLLQLPKMPSLRSLHLRVPLLTRMGLLSLLQCSKLQDLLVRLSNQQEHIGEHIREMLGTKIDKVRIWDCEFL